MLLRKSLFYFFWGFILPLFSQDFFYFEVLVLGIPTGYARYAKAHSENCPNNKTILCQKHIYQINLNKWRLWKKFQILAHVFLEEGSLLMHLTQIKILLDNDKKFIEIYYDEEKESVIISWDGNITEIRSHERNFHTLASIPIYLREKKPEAGGVVHLLLQNEVKKVEFEVLREKDITRIRHGSNDYLVFRGDSWVPEYVSVMPISFFGIFLGEISARKLAH